MLFVLNRKNNSMSNKTTLLDALHTEAAPIDRKSFLKTAGSGIVAATVIGDLLTPASAAAQSGNTAKTKSGSPVKAAEAQKVALPSLDDQTEKKKGPLPAPAPKDDRVGFAIVGIGHLTLEQIMPAFSQCRYAKPVALVSGDHAKAIKVAKQYDLSEKNIYSYASFDDIKANPDIEAIYIVLPNSMHREYTVRAAKAGKHVLCEKPMANTVAEAEEMVAACKAAGRKLMIAYRIQYEPRHRMVQSWLRGEQWGKVKLLDMMNAQNIGYPQQWRLKKALAGGGALPDIGLYCLNTARFLTGEEPEWVMAHMHSTPGDVRFKEVEETVLFQLSFPSGTMASCITSYGVHESRRYRCYADKGGWFGLDPAFPYKGLQIERAEVAGAIENRVMPKMEEHQQFALELDHMARCIREDRIPYTPGEEGVQDMKIMAAIYQSAREGRPVKLEAVGKQDAFRGWKGDDA